MSEKKRVLVVDDEPDYASIVQGQLEKEGFEVDVAYDGVEGLEKVSANPPDAVLLDVMMPEKDGYKMCQYSGYSADRGGRSCDHHAIFSL